MQVLPLAQTVDPVYPIPPHCPYLGTVPEAEELVVVGAVVVEAFVVGAMVVEDVDFVVVVPLPVPLEPLFAFIFWAIAFTSE